MELSPKSNRINLKLIIWFAVIACLLCVMCILLRVKLDGLLDQHMVSHVSQQAALMSDLVEEKSRVRLDALNGMSRHIEGDTSRIEDVLRTAQDVAHGITYGVYSLEGEMFRNDSLERVSIEDFPCITDAFRGKQAVCFHQGKGLLLSVPIYNKRNVKQVLYKLYREEALYDFFDRDCVAEKCLVLLMDSTNSVVMENRKGAWWNDSAWQSLDMDAIFDELDKSLATSTTAVMTKEVDGEKYEFYKIVLKRDGFSLVGMFPREWIAKGIYRISFLVFWVVGLMVLLFLMGFVVWFMMDSKFRERRRPKKLTSAVEEIWQEGIGLLERAGQEMKVLLSRGQMDALANLADNVVDIAKIDSSEIELVPVEYDLFTLLSDCYTKARKGDTRLELVVDSSIPARLRGDEVRLRQVFYNIFCNMDKLSAGNASVVALNYERLLGNGSDWMGGSVNLVIRIPNVGIGWNGIGLALAKRIVHLMHGEFREDGTLDGNTAFEIMIPQEIIKIEPMGDFAKRFENLYSSAGMTERRFYAPDVSVLAIDEVPMNLRVLEGLLKETHVHLDTVGNGMDAIEKFKMSHYDIVFLDHSMPIIDGMDMLTIMKGLGEYPNRDTPIIMLTGMGDVRAREICSQAGYADYLTEPIREEALLSVLLKHLPEKLVHWYDVSKEGELKEVEDSLMDETETLRKEDAAEVVVTRGTERLSLSEDLENLMATGLVDVAVGMECCENNEDLYRKKLNSFAENKFDVVLEKFFKVEDFENYRLIVRVLKARSLYIGAVEIASLAKSVEFACNKGDYDFVHAHHEKMIHRYKKLAQVLKELI